MGACVHVLRAYTCGGGVVDAMRRSRRFGGCGVIWYALMLQPKSPRRLKDESLLKGYEP